MTLERIEHKVFASEAPLEEMGQFGSALATTKLNTKDVAEIQALPAYTKGWGSAIISENNYPAMEEMNGVLNVMSYHTGYLYQEGIPVYSSTQTYSATSMVKSLDGKSIYRSLKGDNKGNPLEDGTSWELFDFSKGTLKTNQITNCLLEEPQRIKLELKDGTLTLKAGSVVIVPNGFEDDGTTPKFDYVTIESDLTVSTTQSNTYQELLFINPYNQFEAVPITYCTSGTTKPTSFFGAYAVWYDTTNNRLKITSNSGSTWVEGLCLPIALITITTTAITSIDQVLNGMGYIGSTVWVDKGVKGLIPNGRNEDGSLKNAEFVTKQLFTYTMPNITQVGISPCLYMDYPTKPNIIYNGEIKGVDYIGDKQIGGTPPSVGWWFDIENNYWKYSGVISRWVPFGLFDLTNGVISNFQPKQPFRAVDYNEFNSKVSKSGDTMTGILQLNGALNGITPLAIFQQKASEVGKATYANILFKNANDEEIGIVGGVENPDGSHRIRLVVKNGSNWVEMPQIIDSYWNGKSGYNIYSSGYCEQCGWIGAGTGTSSVRYNFLKPFANDNFNILYSIASNDAHTRWANQMSLNGWDVNGFDAMNVGGFGAYWCARGYV